jgi:hypothetical protein
MIKGGEWRRRWGEVKIVRMEGIRVKVRTGDLFSGASLRYTSP